MAGLPLVEQYGQAVVERQSVARHPVFKRFAGIVGQMEWCVSNDMDLDGCIEDLDDLGSRGGIWVPTVLNMEAVIRQLGEHSSGGRLITEGLANVARLLPEAVEAGVHILAGTDLAVGTHQVGQEAVRLAEMGLSPKHALRAVSYSGFEATGRPVAFEVDAVADAVMFDANPEEDLGVLAHPRHVIRRGRVVK